MQAESANCMVKIWHMPYRTLICTQLPILVTVRFVAVNPLAGGCNTFAYKLEGFNTRWYETSHLEVNYSNLKPGHYVFKVRAAIPITTAPAAQLAIIIFFLLLFLSNHLISILITNYFVQGSQHKPNQNKL